MGESYRDSLTEDSPIPPRQSAFIDYYLADADLNATRAAIMAGYSPATAASIASNILDYPNVKREVAARKAQREARLNITQDKVLSEMNLLAESRIEHYVAMDDGTVVPAPGAPAGCMAAIKSIERKFETITKGVGEAAITVKTCVVKIQLWDKPGSLKLIGRHVNLFADRVEHVGAGGGPIEIQEIRSTIVDPKTAGHE